MNGSKLSSGFALVLVAALLGWAAWALLRSPCLGVADNLDYWRVMRPAGIEHVTPVERPGVFVRCEFVEQPADLGSGLSSAAVLAWAAKHLGWGLSEEPGRMDLRQVGALYLLLVVGLVVLGLLAGRASGWEKQGRGLSPWLVAALLFVLVDPGYLLFFNSFYADPALFVGLFGAVLWFLVEGNALRSETQARGRAVVAGSILLVLALLGGASKMQYILLPVAVLVAFLSLRGLRLFRREGRSRLVHVSLALALLLVAIVVPLHFFHGPAPRFLQVNNYHAVFAGILQVSERPDRVLDSLGIPPEHRELPRKDVWSGRVPLDHPVHGHLVDLSRFDLLAAYLTEPGTIVRAGSRVRGALTTLESHTRGNRVQSEEHPRKARFDVPWRFSHLRQAILGPWPPLLWAIPLAAMAWLGIALVRRHWSGHHAAALLLLGFVASELVVVILGDGFVALEQHLTGVRLALDLLLVLVVWNAIAGAWGWFRRRRSERGEGSSPGAAGRGPDVTTA